MELDVATAWAQEVLTEPVTGIAELTGGLTSTMLLLDHAAGRSVLRLMDREPWRTHGAALVERERRTLLDLVGTAVPAPRTLGVDAAGDATGHPAHLMSWLEGAAVRPIRAAERAVMAQLLVDIHDVEPAEPHRTFQSWAPPDKRVVPAWSRHPDLWRAAFAELDQEPPTYQPTFLHRDHSHRNLLWHDGDPARISGVVDWVETSTGPAWLDAGHAATSLALAYGVGPGQDLLDRYAALTGSEPQRYWLLLDAAGFLPWPGREPLFGSPAELAALDGWLEHLMTAPRLR